MPGYEPVVNVSDVCWLRLDFESFTLLGPTDSLVNFPAGVVGATAEFLGGMCADAFKVVVSILYQYLESVS